MSALRLGLLSAILSTVNCVAPHAQPSGTDSFNSPAVLSGEAFAAATVADLRSDDELDGQDAVAVNVAVAPPDTFSTPPSLNEAAFAAATDADIERDADTAPALAAVAKPAASTFQITLHRDFVDKIKNKATLTTQFQVMGSSKVHTISSGGEDGDIHVGGVSDEVGLPLVSEVVNAKGNPVVARIKELEQDQETVEVTGAWRIWCEHPGVPQVQFDTPFHGKYPSNPDHVFELHPLTKFDGKSLLSTFVPIPGYTAYDAKKAFEYYESVTCTLEVDAETITIRTPQAMYNYAKFTIEVEDESPLVTTDGRIIRCSVLDEHGAIVTHHRRMVFAKGTPPEKKARTLHQGDRMTVLGIPRVDLAVISWRAKNAVTKPEVLKWRLPYEMIVVAEY